VSAALQGAAVAGQAAPMVTLDQLKRRVMLDEDAPGRVAAADVEHIVGIVAYVLGFAALHQGIAVDLGNGHVLICTTNTREAACAG